MSDDEGGYGQQPGGEHGHRHHHHFGAYVVGYYVIRRILHPKPIGRVHAIVWVLAIAVFVLVAYFVYQALGDPNNAFQGEGMHGARS
jgi:hypothetical protein